MSTYYYGKIYTRKRAEDNEKPNEWELTDTGCFNIFKNLLCGWDPLVDNNHAPWDAELQESASAYYTNEFLGLYDKDTVLKTYKTCNFVDEHCQKSKDCQSLFLADESGNPSVFIKKPEDFSSGLVEILNKSEVEKLDELPEHYVVFEDFVNMPQDEKDKRFVNIYYKEKRHYNGNFYSIDDFLDFEKIVRTKLLREREREYEWKKLKKSVEYLKLNSEEKSNVAEEFDYTNEMIEEYENQLYACNYFTSILDFYDDVKDYKESSWRGRDVIVFLYSS